VSIDFTTEQAGYNAAYVRISLQRNYTIYKIVPENVEKNSLSHIRDYSLIKIISCLKSRMLKL